jgi:hypothetical protein
MSQLNPTDIDVSGAEIVAFSSSDRPDTRHWTELAVFFRPSADGRLFVARSEGCSRVEGQTTRRRAVYVGTLDRALEFFDDSELADAVRLQARDWLDRNLKRVATAVSRCRGAPIGFLGQGGLIGALRWLYRDDEGSWNENVLAIALAQDFGVPARTVRESLKNEREGKELPSWCRAFIASLMHFDRAAFHAAAGRGA